MKIFHTEKQFVSIFMLGFLIGIILTNLIAGRYSVSSELFGEYILSQFQNTEIKTGEYIGYLLKARGLQFLILILVSRMRAKKFGAGIFLLWTGISGGILISTAVLELGIRGSVLCMAGILPQFLFYIPAALVFLLYCWRWPQSRWEQQKTVFVLVMTVLGILCELYINPVLLRFFC